jgi:hypothetical protein
MPALRWRAEEMREDGNIRFTFHNTVFVPGALRP